MRLASAYWFFHFLLLVFTFCLWLDQSLAGEIDKSDLTKQNNKEKLEDEQFGQYLKDNKAKLSTVQKRNDFAHIVKILVQRFNQFTNGTQNPVGSMRSFRTQFSFSPKTLDYLALASLLLYGTMVSFAPERMNEISRHIALEERQGVQNIITSGLVGVSESLMGWVEKSVDDFPSLPRLDAQECMKRCICEAHNQPKKYGLIGLGLQLFFPPYTETDEPSRIVSKYQLAARYGRQENANCAAQYDDCMINMLDIVKVAKVAFRRSSTRRT